MVTTAHINIVAVVAQSTSRLQLFTTLWITAHKASLSLIISRSLPKFMSSESVMPSCLLILCCPSSSSALNFSKHQGLFQWVSCSHQWPKYRSFSFSISPSNEYSGLIFFRIDWFSLLAVQRTQESSPTPQFKSINSPALSVFYCPTLTSIHVYWKNHSFDYLGLCWQSNVSAF